VTVSDVAWRIGDAARQRVTWVQLVKFGLVGGCGYLLNLVVFDLLVNGAAIHHAPAAVCAFCVAVTNNYFWNRYWTFGPGEAAARWQAARFLLVSVASLIINLAVLEVLSSGAELSPLPAQAIAVAVAMPFNFAGNKLWTFS
jgi:dolichol-phosphate mannosyltransferase